MWKIWAASLGPKVGNDRQADGVAIIRTIWWLAHMITCIMIILHNGDRLGWWDVSIEKNIHVSSLQSPSNRLYWF